MSLCSGCGNPVIDGTCACPGLVADLKDKVKALELQIDELKRHWFTIRQAANSMEDILSKTEKRNDVWTAEEIEQLHRDADKLKKDLGL